MKDPNNSTAIILRHNTARSISEEAWYQHCIHHKLGDSEGIVQVKNGSEFWKPDWAGRNWFRCVADFKDPVIVTVQFLKQQN